jgi:predicted transcriptional regulator
MDKMSSKKRDRLEVIRDFLEIIKNSGNSIKPTPLLRKSNLSSQRFIEYFEEMKSKGFVKEEIDKKGRKYITLGDKGFRYLEKYSMITGFISEFEL